MLKQYECRIVLDRNSPDVRITKDNYLLATPRVARTGIQIYGGWEFGLDQDRVRLMRPEEVVFDRDSLASYAHRPITNNHPSEPVTADNWRDVSVGHTGSEVLRDGEHIRVPIALMDGATIRQVLDEGKKELSLGYEMELDFTKAGDGYDATVTSIRANHLAIVDRARGGPELAIGDRGNQTGGKKKMTNLTVNGITVEVADAATAQAIQSHITDLLKQINDAKNVVAAAETKAADIQKKVDEADAKIKTLEQQAEDSKLGPEQLQSLVAERSVLMRIGKAVLGDNTDMTKMSNPDIKRAVVSNRLKDTAKDWTDDQVAVSYNTIVAGIDTSTGVPAPQDMGFGAVLGQLTTPGADAKDEKDPEKIMEKAINDRDSWLANAYKGAQPQQQQ